MLITRSLALSFLLFSIGVFAECPVCYDYSQPPDLTLAPRILLDQTIWSTCGEMAYAAASFFASDSASCQVFINLGFYCGCPVPKGRCTLCSDGSQPPDLTLKPADAGGYTCLDFVGTAATVDLNPQYDCKHIQAIGYFDCGCPPYVTNGCPLCYDGSVPPNLDFAPAEFGGTTCRQLISNLAVTPNTDATSMSCQDWLKLGALCNCPLPETGCKLCEDGSALGNPSTMIGEAACDGFEKMSLFDQGHDCTADQATFGVYCGCTNPKASKSFCRICGGDTLLPNPGLIAETRDDHDYTCAEIESNTVVNAGRALSCTVLQSKYSPICCSGIGTENSDTGTNNQQGNNQGAGTTNAQGGGSITGRVTSQGGSNTGPVNRQGGPVNNQSSRSTNAQAGGSNTGRVTISQGGSNTGPVNSHGGPVNNQSRSSDAQGGGSNTGLVNSQGGSSTFLVSGCPLCYDGSAPPNLDFAPAEFGGTTCRQMINALATPSADGPTMYCRSWLELGALYCNCPLPETGCKLCEDGSDLPNPSAMIGASSCDAFAKLSLFDKGQDCTASQATFGVYCGCSNPLASNSFCRICGGDTLLPNPGLIAETRGDHDYTCAEMESNTVVNVGRAALSSCTDLQSTYGPTCCSGIGTGNSDTGLVNSEDASNAGPVNSQDAYNRGLDNSCPFCYDGSAPPNLGFAPANFEGATCLQKINELMATDGTTMSCQDWLIIGGFCNCPLPEDGCKLCEDGSEVPNPSTMIGEDTCATFAIYSVFDKEEDCTADQATIGVYCGCTNPQASESFCRICGGDTLLPYPGLIADTIDNSYYTCAEIESNTEVSLGRAAMSCTELQSTYGPICCSDIGTENPRTADDDAQPVGPVSNPLSNILAHGGEPSNNQVNNSTPTGGGSSSSHHFFRLKSGAVMTAILPISVFSATLIGVLGANTLFT